MIITKNDCISVPNAGRKKWIRKCHLKSITLLEKFNVIGCLFHLTCYAFFACFHEPRQRHRTWVREKSNELDKSPHWAYICVCLQLFPSICSSEQKRWLQWNECDCSWNSKIFVRSFFFFSFANVSEKLRFARIQTHMMSERIIKVFSACT